MITWNRSYVQIHRLSAELENVMISKSNKLVWKWEAKSCHDGIQVLWLHDWTEASYNTEGIRMLCPPHHFITTACIWGIYSNLSKWRLVLSVDAVYKVDTRGVLKCLWHVWALMNMVHRVQVLPSNSLYICCKVTIILSPLLLFA